MKKYYYVGSFIFIVLVSFIGVTYSYEDIDNGNLLFQLKGDNILYLDVGEDYYEYGVMVSYEDNDITDKVNIDSSSINVDMVGEYLVKYSVKMDYYEEYIYRKVVVVDRIKPVIELIGDREINIYIGDDYYEYGYRVYDNYDGDISKKVEVSGEVDTSRIGTYMINYRIVDSSGNSNIVTRIVNVIDKD